MRGLVVAAVLSVTACDQKAPEQTKPPAGASPAQSAKVARAPIVDAVVPERVLWGDTHVHTSNSNDAFAFGARLEPEAAYRFARGDEVTAPTGQKAKLSRPLDFVAISDHAEGMGWARLIFEGDRRLLGDARIQDWRRRLQVGGIQARQVLLEIERAQRNGTLPAPLRDRALVTELLRGVWRDNIATAEKYNRPRVFTTLLAFEWTGQRGNGALHRSVVFRDAPDRVEKISPLSAWESDDPRLLWGFLGDYEKTTGGRALAIPHSGAASAGQMFALARWGARPPSKADARQRARFEPLYEITQVHGTSETHPFLSPTDDYADDGFTGEPREISRVEVKHPQGTQQFEYARPALKNGLVLQRELGVNPFAFGFVGGSNTHNGISAIAESAFLAQDPTVELSPLRARTTGQEPHDEAFLGWHCLASGRTAVWAVENTREAIWDALYRGEVYATTGPRITLRFFAGFSFTLEQAQSDTLAREAYASGVPMGTVLEADPGGKPPTFIVAASKDPEGAHLDRIQIIKGWLDREGMTHERVYDVVWADAERRKPDATGKIPPVGNTVDVEQATYTNSIGDAELRAVWGDPNFDPKQPAFYYVRVIEIPTPRWTAYGAQQLGEKTATEVQMVTTERAFSSPIWYAP